MSSLQHKNATPLLEIYRTATRIRQTDQHIRRLIDARELDVNYYSAAGQEILTACMAANLTDEDYLVTIYRGIHDQIAKGIPLNLLFAEYFGKAAGACSGKGGPMHLTCPEKGVMVTTGIVGSGMPIGNGFALASLMKRDGRVTVTNFGDGAANIGAFGESLNLAAVWRLPIVFLCQNNLYAERTAIAVSTAGNIWERAIGYGMPGVRINGNDPVAMYEAAREAVARARGGEGPTLIEACTFRFLGHNYGDPGLYIPSSEMVTALARDPVPKLRAAIVEQGIADEAELAALEKEIDHMILSAIQFAKETAFPDPLEVTTDVFGAPGAVS